MEKILGQRIRKMREHRGLTQEQLAEKLDMKPANVSSYERNKSVPPSDVLSELASILNTSTEYLLGKTDNHYPIDEEVMEAAIHVFKQLDESLRYFTSLMNEEYPFSKKMTNELFSALDKLVAQNDVKLDIKLNVLQPIQYNEIAEAIIKTNNVSFKLKAMDELKKIVMKYHLWDDPRDIWTVKENPALYQTEAEFVSKIDLSDEELLEEFKIVVDGRELSEKEMKKIIAFVRLNRQIDED